MANCRIGYIFPSDSATLTPSSENSDFPASNLQDERPGKVWQSVATELTNITLDFDMGAATEIGGVALFEHNLTADATVDVQADDASDYSSLDVDQSVEENLATLTKQDGSEEVIPRLAYWWESAEEYRYWRVKITDAANPDTYLEIGRLVLFKYTEPEVNVSNSVRREPVDPSIIVKTAGRFPRKKARSKYWRYSVDFGAPHVSREQQDEWLALINEIGLGEGVVFGLDPTDYPTEDTIYGTLNALGSFQHVFLGQSEINGIEIIEARAG